MNEIQLLRAQLAAERRRVREVAAAGAAAGGSPAAFAEACAAYLACVLGWFEQRDARLPAAVAIRGALAAAGESGGAREALALLRTAGDTPAGWQALAHFIQGRWDTRRGAIEACLATDVSVADWRTYAGVDADSIVRERALYRQVRAALPAGVDLA